MSRQDRRPLSQVPEDSVNPYMQPLTSYQPTQESFTLNPPYNPTDLNIFDTFAYYPSDADPYLSDPNWASYLSTDVQNVSDTGLEYPYLPSMRFPELEALYAPVPLPAQPFLLLPEHTNPEHESLPHNTNADHPTPACDLTANANLNLTDLFPGLFPDTEYSDLSVPPPPTAVAPHMLALDMTGAYSEVPPGPQDKKSPRRSRAARLQPTPGPSSFIPSDPDDLSSHEKKRLYLECLEHYVQYLHQFFASLNVQPLPLERVSSYRGLTSRSMRTILLTLNKSADMIHSFSVAEANKFLDASEGFFQDEAAVDYTQIHGSRDTAVSPSSDSAGTSSTCVTSEPDPVEFSKYFADPFSV
ncbi:hypothetical protein DFH09DRAFT_319433 [Mycena vulgaris]|nr:hypothetical protein DFH09DRAFT_319433 [Mycena vulgaris]